MTVRKIESGGIRVTYRKLNPDDLSRYKKKPKDSHKRTFALWHLKNHIVWWLVDPEGHLLFLAFKVLDN